MTSRDLLLVLHLVAVAAWLGANLLQFVVGPRLRARDVEVARAWSETSSFLGRRYYSAVGALVTMLAMVDKWAY